MTIEQRQEIERLDRWLAVQEVTGRRFSPGLSCTMTCYADESARPRKVSQDSYAGVMAVMDNLWMANDRNGGYPGAVRAKLHELYPFLTETPALTEVTHV